MNWGYTYLSCPYESWEKESVQRMFSEVVAIKKTGYSHNYQNILPIDSLDFISDHYIVWIEIDGQRHFISVMRGVSLRKLNHYNQQSPCNQLLNTISNVTTISEHLESLHIMLDRFKNIEEKVTFFNGWTIKPEYRGKDEVSQLLKLASVACISFVQEELGSNRIGLGSGMPHLKTDKILEEMGYSSWELNNKPLPPLPSPAFNMKETIFMQGNSTPPEFLKKINFLKKVWDNREIIGEKRREKEYEDVA